MFGLLIVHIFITLALIGSILLQKSEGAGLPGMSGKSGGGLFSARGTANFMTRLTAILATLFIGNCLLMGILSKHQLKNQTSIMDQVDARSKE